MTAEEMWQCFGKAGSYEETAFGDGADADHLAALILDGKKRATTSAFYWYETGEDRMPQPGQYTVVLDSRGNAVCIVRTTRVYVTSFDQVSAEHARLEGEGDLSLEYWRNVHRAFFAADLAEANQDFSETMDVVCEEFEKVYP